MITDEPAYDAIGVCYAARRRPDPKLAVKLHSALGNSATVLNVGAGAGSYEPTDRIVVAVEPSRIMIAQRPPDAVPAVIARAEQLPFVDSAFDASMAVLTVHHWADMDRGLAELRRVTAGPIVVLTHDPSVSWWLMDDYAPEISEHLAETGPTIEAIVERLGGAEVQVVPVPANCSDAFLLSFWNRPELVLNPKARAATSGFAKLSAETQERAARELATDLEDGTWEARHGYLRQLAEFDAGLRLITTCRS